MVKKINKIAIIGLGYVGLPLALEFGKKFETIGFDIKFKRIKELKRGLDINNEHTKKEIRSSKLIKFTNDKKQIKNCNTYIVTVPTPAKKNKPDLSTIKNASILVANNLKKNDLVIYESTVYPGLSEELSYTILEKISKLKLNNDFFLGYSPERINPGDKKHTIKNITKVVSGSNQSALTRIDKLYKSIVLAGTYKAKSIKIAEAAKVIENTQRDINIAFMNELEIIFSKMKINIYDVLKTAGTKWNFLNFKPGLVGGHCIGVDPFYLTYKSQLLGYDPKIILAGRKINDSVPKLIFRKLHLKLKKLKKIKRKKILIMGFSFKENISDVRNTKIYDIITEFIKNNYIVDIFDPIADKDEAKKYYNISLTKKPKKNNYDAVLIAVKHRIFIKMGIKTINSFRKRTSLIYDYKNLFSKSDRIYE